MLNENIENMKADAKNAVSDMEYNVPRKGRCKG